MNIAYSCDEMYIPHTGISILSLLENNKEIDHINIYFIEKEVSNKSLELLKKLVDSYNRKLIIVSFNELCVDLKINNLGRHIETIYAKLFISQIEVIDKIIYIDSDTIINNSLKELWNIDLEDNFFGGVNAKAINSAALLSLEKSDPFINDGVVIINVKHLRKHNMLNKFKNYIEKYDGNPPYLSEGVINMVCKGQIKIIHPKFNLMSGLIEFKGNRFAYMDFYYSKDTLKESVYSPVIIHYLAAFYNRPWDINCTHPFKERYIYYKSISFWKDVPHENKKLNIKLRFYRFIYKIVPHDILDFIQYVKNLNI